MTRGAAGDIGPQEKSCGAVLYTIRDGIRLFWLVRNVGGHIGFPKGHMEPGESEAETALRELREETGRIAILDTRFRKSIRYLLPNGNPKETVFFLARFDDDDPASPAAEISEAWLEDAVTAISHLSYDAERDVLAQAIGWLDRQP